MDAGVDYDGIADRYDERYAAHDYTGVEAAVRDFVVGGARVLEVGCGTGRWLQLVERRGGRPVGLDRSRGMLEVARRSGPTIQLVEGSALDLPFDDEVFDAVLVVNALHHFADTPAFVSEARRVLRRAGRMMTIGLDPSLGRDQWFVYEHFPGTLSADRERYPPTQRIRSLMGDAGFVAVESHVAQRWDESVRAEVILDDREAARRSCSQLLLLDDSAFAAGMRSIRDMAARAAARDREATLHGHLALHATTGTVPESPVGEGGS